MKNEKGQTGQMDLLAGPDLCRLSHQEREVLKELMARPGRGNTVTSRTLGRQFGIGAVEVRGIVRRLRLAGAPIGSNATGFFWISDPAEARSTAAHFKSRIREMAQVVAVLEGQTLAEVAGQLRMQLIHDAVPNPPKDTGRDVAGGDNVVECLDNPEE